MKLLLDTHVWLWVLLEPQRLNRRAARAIENLKNEIWLSPVSLWEAASLHAKGKIRLSDGFDAWTAAAFEQLPCREAPLTFDIALDTRAITLPHNDPADRFIGASARVFGLTLVTADEKLIACKDIPTMTAG